MRLILHLVGSAFAFLSARRVQKMGQEEREMSNKRDDVVDESAIKNPDDWKTGDEPMTAAQRSYLETLATQAGEEADTGDLTKAEASKRIDELRKKTGLNS